MTSVPLDSLPRIASVLMLALAMLFSATAALAAPPINTLEGGASTVRTDTAILGHDTVAYFTDGKPIKGNEEFTVDWMGAKWQFASKEHLDLFKAEPDRYAPQYGGYCAYGVAKDGLVSIEPDRFKVIDGKLYLNYNDEVQTAWLKDPAGYIRQADKKFKSLLQQ